MVDHERLKNKILSKIKDIAKTETERDQMTSELNRLACILIEQYAANTKHDQYE